MDTDVPEMKRQPTLMLHRCCLSLHPPLQMAGLQEGRKIFTINEDLVFLRPFQEVETMINQAFCIRRSLRLLVNTKAKE